MQSNGNRVLENIKQIVVFKYESLNAGGLAPESAITAWGFDRTKDVQSVHRGKVCANNHLCARKTTTSEYQDDLSNKEPAPSASRPARKIPAFDHLVNHARDG